MHRKAPIWKSMNINSNEKSLVTIEKRVIFLHARPQQQNNSLILCEYMKMYEEGACV